MAGNGGIIGPVNVLSNGKNTITSKTSSGDLTTQPGTRLLNTVVVAGGGGGGGAPSAPDHVSGGGGAGGAKVVECISVGGGVAYPITVGGGGPGASAGGQGTSGSLLQVFHLTLSQFVEVEVEVVDLQEQLQELMVDQVVVDLLLHLTQHLILEQEFVDKVIQVEEEMMQLLPL